MSCMNDACVHLCAGMLCVGVDRNFAYNFELYRADLRWYSDCRGIFWNMP